MESALSLVLALKWHVHLITTAPKYIGIIRDEKTLEDKLGYYPQNLQNFKPAWSTLRQQCCSAPSLGCWHQVSASAVAFGQVSLCPHCTQLGAIPVSHTKVWGIAMCSSTCIHVRRWAKRSRMELISVWLALQASVGWKVWQKWMLYKYFWVLGIQATGKARLRADSVIRICGSHHSDGAWCDAVCSALPAPLRPSRSSKGPSDGSCVSLRIPVLSYVLKNGFSFFFLH